MKQAGNNYREQEIRAMTEKKVRKLKQFYIHALVFLAGIIVYILKHYFDAPLHFFPFGAINWFLMSIWATVFAIQSIDIFVTTIVVGRKWEGRQIRKVVKKQSKKQIMGNHGK